MRVLNVKMLTMLRKICSINYVNVMQICVELNATAHIYIVIDIRSWWKGSMHYES